MKTTIRLKIVMKKIELTKGFEAIVDDEVFDFIIQWEWYVLNPNSKYPYAVRRDSDRRLIFMHKIIMCGPPSIHVDHINGLGLDNQRHNLRVATLSQNCANRKKRSDNTSGFKGVLFKKDCQRWLAQIMIGGKRKLLGTHKNPVDAAKAYDLAASELFGEYALTNHQMGLL